MVNVDGKFYGAYSAEAGARVEESIEFGEDTGNHLVEVFQAGTSEWKLIQSATVTSDCVVPPVVTPPVVEPPVVQPPAAKPPVAAAVVSQPTEQLAQTGLDLPIFPIALVASVMFGGGAWLLVMARRRKVEIDSAE